MSHTQETLTRERKALQDAVDNAVETLADGMDDTSCLDQQEIAELRAILAGAKKALSDFDQQHPDTQP